MDFEDLPRGLPNTTETEGMAPRALWQHPDTLTENEFWQYTDGKVFLGAWDNQLLGVADNRHLVTIAGTRAGKGTSVVLPNLLVYEGSVFCIDPKGENATKTAERRGQGNGVPAGGMGQDVFVLDPFGVADVPAGYRAGFNPFDVLDPDDPNFIDDCDSLADALIVAEVGKENDFWNSSARLVIRGFVAWIAAAGGVKDRSLNELKRLLFLRNENTDEEKGFTNLLARMSVLRDVAHGVPAEAANMLLSLDLRERGSVLGTVRQNIGFLASPPMAECLSSTARAPDLKNWKHGNTSIYLCLPAGRLHRHRRFLRLFINLLMSAIERDVKTPETPALMLLDEMHVLGHMSVLETATGLIAGYGVRIWSIWQDLSQLKDLYRDRWETFLGNAGILQVFGLNDLTTLEYVSKRLGTSSALSVSQGEVGREQALGGFTGLSKSVQPFPLLQPEEVAYFFSRQSGNQLLLYAGADPIFCHRVPFYTDTFKDVRP